MKLINFADIPRSALAALLDMEGKSQGISPRPLLGKPCKFNPHQLAELYAGGFIELPNKPTVTLSPAFVQVAKVLLNPHTNVTFRLWGKDSKCGETNIQFPRDIVQGDGVILNQIGRIYRISAFVDDSDVTKLVGQAIPDAREELSDFEFRGLFEVPVAAILFGALDMAREQARNAKKSRDSVTDLVFSTQQLYDYMFERWSFTGFKDLLTYIVAAGMMAEAPSLSQTVDGLRALAKAGVLKENKADHYQLLVAMEPLVKLTAGMQSGIQWQRVTLMETGDQVVSNRMYLFGDKSFILCLAPTVAGKIYISRVKRQEIIDFIVNEIMAKLEPLRDKAPAHRPAAAPAAAPATAGAFCTQCGAALRPNAKHCSNCGAPVVAKAAPATPTCPKCGASLKPGAKFCSKCGTVITGQPAPTGQATCPKCGHTLKPGAKFCANCGTRI